MKLLTKEEEAAHYKYGQLPFSRPVLVVFPPHLVEDVGMVRRKLD